MQTDEIEIKENGQEESETVPEEADSNFTRGVPGEERNEII